MPFPDPPLVVLLLIPHARHFTLLLLLPRLLPDIPAPAHTHVATFCSAPHIPQLPIYCQLPPTHHIWLIPLFCSTSVTHALHLAHPHPTPSPPTPTPPRIAAVPTTPHPLQCPLHATLLNYPRSHLDLFVCICRLFWVACC